MARMERLKKIAVYLSPFIFLGCVQPKEVDMSSKSIIEVIKNCPDSPNCVSSLVESKTHHLEALPFVKPAEIKEIILKFPRVKLETETDESFHFIFTSLIFRFKDDLWLYFDRDQNRIDFKSASRVGHSDLGVNKKRVEKIRKEILKKN